MVPLVSSSIGLVRYVPSVRYVAYLVQNQENRQNHKTERIVVRLLFSRLSKVECNIEGSTKILWPIRLRPRTLEPIGILDSERNHNSVFFMRTSFVYGIQYTILDNNQT